LQVAVIVAPEQARRLAMAKRGEPFKAFRTRRTSGIRWSLIKVTSSVRSNTAVARHAGSLSTFLERTPFSTTTGFASISSSITADLNMR